LNHAGLRLKHEMIISNPPLLPLLVNPVRNSSGALNPAGIILKSNPAAAADPEGLWPGGRSGALFLTG